MRCPKCGHDNKENAKFCVKCKVDLKSILIEEPTWKWHLKVLAIIYAILGIAYILLRIFLKD
ncbi:MAG: zinc ribbon domain-containing protein [bacterium]